MCTLLLLAVGELDWVGDDTFQIFFYQFMAQIVPDTKPFPMALILGQYRTGSWHYDRLPDLTCDLN